MRTAGAYRFLAGWLVVLACSPSAEAPTDELRVISLAPSITRVVQALGAEDSLVAVDGFSRRLPGLGKLPSVGGLFNPDLERTLELRPTVLLAVRSARQHPFIEQLRARGVRVAEIEPYTLEEVLGSFRTIGTLVGRNAEADELVAEVRRDLEEVATSVHGLERRSVVVVIERDPLYVIGGGSFANTLIETAGGRNAFVELDSPYPPVSLESLADRAPDVILDTVIDPDAGPEARRVVEAYWKRFGWVRRVEAFPAGLATLPGPELAEGARLLAAHIHPDRPRGGRGTGVAP
jgi:iron complex transport system substrate-binding protein